VLGAVLIVFGTWIATSLLNPEQTKAAWFDTSWLYRQTVPVTNDGTALQSTQIPIVIDTASLISTGKMRSDCRDIRVTSSTGKVLKQWVHLCNTSTTVVYVWALNVPVGNSNFYIYYGNKAASTSTDIKTGTSQYPGISCKTILDHGDSTGNGTYTIDPNAGSPTDSFSATCDMTTDNGGWTIVNSSNGTTNQQGLTSDTEVSGDPFNDESSNISLLKKQDIATLSAESLIKRNNGKWLKVSVPFFDNKLTTPNQHPHNTSVTLTADDGTTISTAVAGYSNYLNSGGGDYGITTSVGFDHHNSTIYYHLRGGCGSHYFYKYGTTYNVNTALGSWTQSIACGNNSTALGPWYGGIRGTNPPVPAYLTISSPTSEEYSPGPVGYWSMDEGSGTIVHDKTTNGSNGTISGATWQPDSRCKVGKCLYFDGSNDSVDFGNISPRASISGNLTVSFWIKPTNIAKGRQNPLGKAYGGEYDLTLETSGSLSMYHGSAGNDASPYTTFNSPVISQSDWTHVVYTRDTATRTVKIYLNGKLRTTGTYSSTYDPVPSTRSFKFGYEYAGYFQGYLDEVMLFPTTKTQSEINALYSAGNAGVAAVKGISVSAGTDDKTALNQGLVGYWKMDEVSWNGTTGEVGDSSGTNNNGTSVNGADASTSAKFGNAGYFAGVDEYISLGTPTTNKSRSYSIWAKPNAGASAAGRDGLFGENGGTRIDYGNGVGSTNFHALILLNAGSPNYKELTGTGNGTSDWSHIVLTIDDTAGVGNFYVNGSLTSTVTWDKKTQSATAGGAQYLAFVNNLAKYNGNLDEARMYNRALTPAEVSNLYHSAPGPVAYYPFEDASGTTSIADKSSHGLNLTTSGSPTFVPGKYGRAIKFADGSLDGASLSNALYKMNNYTYGFWFRYDTGFDGSFRQIFSLYGASDRQPGLWRYSNLNCFHSVADPGNLGFSCIGPTGTSTYWQTGKWYYYSQTKNGTTLTAYVNGIKVATTTVSDPMTTSTTPTMYLGKSISYNSAGISLDEFKLYNYSRTGGQITEDMNAGHPLGGSPIGSQVGYWKMDEGYGTTINNSGNAGSTVKGTVSSCRWTNDAKYARGLDCNNGGSISFGANSALDASQFTYSFWIKPGVQNSNGAYGNIIMGRETYLTKGFRMGLGVTTNTNGKVSFWSTQSGGTLSLVSNSSITDGKWHYIAISYDGSAGSMYIDGKLENSATGTFVVPSGISLVLNGGVGGTVKSNSLFDEFKFYSSALTADQVKLDMNRGSSLVLGSLGTSNDGTASTSAGAAYCVPGDSSSCAAPVGEWNFEEGTGSTVNDTSSNGKTGTWQGTLGSQWTQGKVGKAGKFNGSNNYVSAATIPAASVTAQAWVYSSNFAGNMFVVQKAPVNAEWELFFESALKWRGGSTTSISCTAPANNQWHFVVGTQTGTTATLYIDGKQCATGTVTALPNGTGVIDIGRHSGSGYFFNGKIDQVKVYDYVRTPAQIAYDFNRGAPVARWKTDECQGSTLHDASGNRADGTITVGGSGTQTSVGTCATASTAWGNGAIGKFNSSLNFDGTDDYVNMGQPSILQITSSMTLSAWVKTTDSGLGGFIGKWYNTPGNRGYRFLTNNGDLELHISSDGTADASCTINPGINDGTWQFVAAVYNASTGEIQLYNNGKLVKSCTGLPNSIYNNSINFNLGTSDAGTTGSNTLSGQMDDVQIFNYALTPTQVRNLMNQNSSVRYGPLQGTP